MGLGCEVRRSSCGESKDREGMSRSEGVGDGLAFRNVEVSGEVEWREGMLAASKLFPQWGGAWYGRCGFGEIVVSLSG